METRWLSSTLLGFFLIGLIGCRGAEIRLEEISCLPASAILSPAVPNGKITAAWESNKSEKLAGYKVYYGLSSRQYRTCVDIGSPAESSPGVIQYTLIGLEKGKRYYIAVIAYDKNGNKSGLSGEVDAIAE